MANTTADKLALLATNKANIKAAIVAKNPATAPTDVMSQWPTAIASIPSGARNWRGYRPPDDWPDIPAILDANKESGYAYACAFLMDPAQKEVRLCGAAKFKCSDGFTTTASNTVHTWTDTGYHWCVALNNDKFFNVGVGDYRDLTGSGYKARTVCVYGDGDAQIRLKWGGAFCDTGNNTSKAIRCLLVDFISYEGDNYYFINGYYALEYVKGRIFFNSATPSLGMISMVSDCFSLKEVHLYPQSAYTQNSGSRLEAFRSNTNLQVIDFTFPTPMTTCFGLFNGLTTLREFSNSIDYSNAVSIQYLFQNCYCLLKINDTMDLKVCTSTSNAFNGCRSLVSLPKNVTLNVSISFSSCDNVTDKDSVATFDENGNVVGGFVGNLRSWDGTQYVDACPNSGQTITFNNNIKALFTTDEWTAVKSALTAKNWGCSPA